MMSSSTSDIEVSGFRPLLANTGSITIIYGLDLSTTTTSSTSSTFTLSLFFSFFL